MSKSKIGVRVYLLLSAIAGALVGVIWFYGTRKLNDAIIAGGLTFVVVLVGIATLTLMSKDDSDPNQPRLK